MGATKHDLRIWFLMVYFVFVSNYNVLADSIVPCYFIFGDSLVDNGNNNNMTSQAKSNYPPYGIDFIRGPTGRFSNGVTSVDVIAQLLGFEHEIPPYVNTKGKDILRGLNYASAAGGIRPESGSNLGFRFSFSGQVNNYKNTVSELVKILGDEKETSKYLRQCIYTVTFGSNDYLNNYYRPDIFPTSKLFNPEQYAAVLIQQQFAEIIKTLYDLGARKMAFFGLGPIGCSPNARTQNSTESCLPRMNNDSKLFNRNLKQLVHNFNKKLPDGKFTYINSYGIFQDMIARPSLYGFNVTNAGCCGIGKNSAQYICQPLQIPCTYRDEYLFWDAWHPSAAANTVLGCKAFAGKPSTHVSPFNIRRLAQL